MYDPEYLTVRINNNKNIRTVIKTFFVMWVTLLSDKQDKGKSDIG